MKNRKRGVSLLETVVTMCVATMLFISLGSSFYMFRVLNKNTIKNSKKELNIVSIIDYIKSNADRIIVTKIGGRCMYVDVDELSLTYDIFLYNKDMYLVDVSHSGKFLEGRNATKVTQVTNIGMFKENGEPILTVHGDYIIKFNFEEYFDENMHFYMADYSHEEEEKIVPVYQFTDRHRDYYDEIGESLYYSIIDDPELLTKMLDGLFTYKDSIVYIMQPNGSKEELKTKGLFMNLNGVEEIIFDNLPYDSLDVSFSVDSESFTITDENGTLVPTYGVETKVAILEEDGTLTYVDNPDHGVAYVSESNIINGTATVSAREVLMSGESIKRMKKKSSGDDSGSGETVVSLASRNNDDVLTTTSTNKDNVLTLVSMSEDNPLRLSRDDETLVLLVSQDEEDVLRPQSGTYLEPVGEDDGETTGGDDSGGETTGGDDSGGETEGGDDSGGGGSGEGDDSGGGTEGGDDSGGGGDSGGGDDSGGGGGSGDDDSGGGSSDVDDDDDEYIEIVDNLFYSYRFVGWDIDGEMHDVYDKEVVLPEGGQTKTCTAVFERKLSERNTDFDEKTIDESLRYTITSKVMYMVNCSIKYRQTYQDESADEITKNFVLGVYYKYNPEVYTGDE